MHPVPCGLIAAVQDPASEDGAVGGSGNSEIFTGSGFGGGGILPHLSAEPIGFECF